jgi:hypothetical protein
MNNVVHEGYATKEGSGFPKSWKKRMFVLRDDCSLSYYRKRDVYRNEPLSTMKISSFRETMTKGKPHCLELQGPNNGRTLFMCFNSDSEMREWMEALQKLGLTCLLPIQTGDKKQTPQKNTATTQQVTGDPEEILTAKDVSQWPEHIVLEFLKRNMLAPNVTVFDLYGSKFHQINGKKLEKLDMQQLQEMGIDDCEHCSFICDAINTLKINRVFSIGQYYVFQKLSKLIDKNEAVTVASIASVARALSSAQELRTSYLSTETIPDSTVIYVKLVITEIMHSDFGKQFRKLISPFVSNIPLLKQEFGMFHSALIIGPWYLEWTDSSLCIPRTTQSSMALISSDIEALSVCKEKLGVVANNLAAIIAEWNTNYTYSSLTGKGSAKKYGNCQDFVDYILAKLGLSINYEGAMGDFLRKMQTFGTCAIEFSPTEAFRSKFKLSQAKYQFSTHSQLDQFVQQLLFYDDQLSINHSSEWQLLKSFDRAFWLRHFKNKLASQFAPWQRFSSSKCDCPFKDPLETKSYLM